MSSTVYFVRVSFTHKRSGERGQSNIIVTAQDAESASALVRSQLDLSGCTDVFIGEPEPYPLGIANIVHVSGPRVVRRA